MSEIDYKEYLKKEKHCDRCDRMTTNFIPDHQMCCRVCLTDQELKDYILPDITKEMAFIRPKLKVKIIKEILREYDHWQQQEAKKKDE